VGALFSIVIATFFTAFYSFRLFVAVFLKKFNTNFSIVYSVHESSRLMVLPLGLLLSGSIFVGFVFSDFFIGFGNTVFSVMFGITAFDLYLFETDLISVNLKIIIFIILILFSMGLVLSLFNSVIFQRVILNLNISNGFMFSYFFLFNSK
jgi:NADH-ubiquinone oxidoreductase chain 5